MTRGLEPSHRAFAGARKASGSLGKIPISSAATIITRNSSGEGAAVDMVVVEQELRFTIPCERAELIHLDWEGDPERRVASSRLKHSRAEIAYTAYTADFGAGPCVVIAQGHEDDLIATLFIKMKEARRG